MKKLFLTISHKGGVGKSTISKAFADYLRYGNTGKERSATALIDTDHENQSLQRVYGQNDFDLMTGVKQFNLDNPDDAREVISDIVRTPADTVLVDLRGGALNILLSTFNQDTPEDNAQRMIAFFNRKDIQVNFLIVFDIEPTAVQTAIDLVNLFGPNVRYFFLENILRTKDYERALDLLLNHEVYSKQMTNSDKTVFELMVKHGEYIRFPRLHPAPALILKIHNATYRNAAHMTAVMDDLDIDDTLSWLEKTDRLFAEILQHN